MKVFFLGDDPVAFGALGVHVVPGVNEVDRPVGLVLMTLTYPHPDSTAKKPLPALPHFRTPTAAEIQAFDAELERQARAAAAAEGTEAAVTPVPVSPVEVPTGETSTEPTTAHENQE